VPGTQQHAHTRQPRSTGAYDSLQRSGRRTAVSECVRDAPGRRQPVAGRRSARTTLRVAWGSAGPAPDMVW
jgi:hypothetical protein